MGRENGFTDLPSALLPEMEDLPGELKEIAGVIGVKNTIKLAQAYRGCTVYIRNVDYLLRKKRDAEIRAEYDNGGNLGQIARKYHLSTRQIHHILNQADTG